jgi:hypothetical protein
LTSLAGVTLTGAAAGNYYVAGVGPQTLTANITPRPITINSGLTANDKVYDGTVAATLAAGAQTLAGVLAADAGNVTVSSSGPYTGTWSQANVGTGLTVTPSTTPTTIAGGMYNAMSGVALSGTAAGNYYVTGATSSLMGNIYEVPQSINHLVLNQINAQKTNIPVSSGGVSISERQPQVNTEPRRPALVLTQLDEASQVTDILLFTKSQDFSYALQGEISSAEQQEIRYTATLVDGRPLPSWLKLDEDRGTVRADAVPLDSLPVQYRINRIVQGRVQEIRNFALNKSQAR